MRWLANYLRQVFCRHEFHVIYGEGESVRASGATKQGPMIAKTCRKCGYHTSGWLFNG